jgi:uncharacterized damage-inducible protein DinB
MAAKRDDGGKELASIKEWYQFNSYVRKKYLDSLEKLPQEELMRDRGASFPSVLDIFAHVLDAYRSWFMFRYPGVPMESFKNLEGSIKSVGEAREEERKVDSFVLNFVEGLDDEKLNHSFETSDPQDRWRFSLKQMLWHMVEEELQHRGELNALLWQMNIDPPITDWLDWKTEIGEAKKLT